MILDSLGKFVKVDAYQQKGDIESQLTLDIPFCNWTLSPRNALDL